MAKRIRLTHDEATRKRIQTTQLVKRLQDNALSEKEIMTQGQIASAKILLNKALPDLQSVEITSDPDNPIKHEHTINWLTEKQAKERGWA